MSRYWRLWISFLKASWIADIEYRFNIVFRVLSELVWYAVQLSVFEVLYTHAPTISGWDVHAMRVFMGSLFLVDNTYMLLFQENMDNLNTAVRKGDLDLYLTKPINSQFMVSFRRISTAYFANLLLIIGYLAWAIPALNHPVSALQLLSYAFVCVCGLATYYALRFSFGTLVILMQDAGNIQFVWHQLFRLATRPDPIYPSFLRMAMLTVFPVAFMASVPSRILVEGIDPVLLVAAPGFSLFLIFISHVFWNFALRRYSSASS